MISLEVFLPNFSEKGLIHIPLLNSQWKSDEGVKGFDAQSQASDIPKECWAVMQCGLSSERTSEIIFFKCHRKNKNGLLSLTNRSYSLRLGL